MDQEAPGPDQSFAENVRVARESKGWTQTDFVNALQLAGLTNFHQTTVSRLEKGERLVRLGEAATIAQVLDVPLDRLTSPPSRFAVDQEFQESVRVFNEHWSDLRNAAITYEEARTSLRQFMLDHLDSSVDPEQRRKDADAMPEAWRVVEEATLRTPTEYMPTERDMLEEGEDSDGVDR